ncbi:putative high-affinity nicotinic acid transporter [Meredithblackwellia eburnea MCA 4105]
MNSDDDGPPQAQAQAQPSANPTTTATHATINSTPFEPPETASVITEFQIQELVVEEHCREGEQKDTDKEASPGRGQEEYDQFLRLKAMFQQDPAVHDRLVRRLDYRILPMLFIFYLLNSLDKNNAGNVRIYTFLADTNMTPKQFNLALSWFFFTYAGFEAPSNMILRKVGARRWLSFLVVCWGIVTFGTAWCRSHTDYYIFRILLGVFEAGMFQGALFTLSCWYPSEELQTRCALWYSAAMLSGAFSGLLAYSVGGLDGRYGMQQWQFLFICEGSITITAGLVGFFTCVDFPGRWSSRFFTPDEMQYLSQRVKYQSGPVAPDEEFRWSALWEAMKDWKTYAIASLLAFGGSTPTYSINFSIATIVRGLGVSTISAQALTAPPYVFAFFCVIAIARYSDKYQCRARSLLISYSVGLLGLVILWPSLYHPKLHGLSYFSLFLVIAGFNMQAPAVGSWLGTNVRNPAKRAGAMGWQSTLGQLVGGCTGSNIFLAHEAPVYPTAFAVIFILVIFGGVGVTLINWYCLRAANRAKDQLGDDAVSEYTEEQLSKMGEYSPSFR